MTGSDSTTVETPSGSAVKEPVAVGQVRKAALELVEQGRVQEAVDLFAAQPSCRALGYLRPLKGVAGIRDDDLHSDEEAVEG